MINGAFVRTDTVASLACVKLTSFATNQPRNTALVGFSDFAKIFACLAFLFQRNFKISERFFKFSFLKIHQSYRPVVNKERRGSEKS